MAIQIARYMLDGLEGWGVVHGGFLAPLSGGYVSTADFITYGIEEARNSIMANATVALDRVTLLSPITRDRQFVCQGTNYASHVRESGLDPNKISFNTIFTKASSCITSATADVQRPSHVQLLDYEIELGLVMRRPMTGTQQVTEGNLHEWLAGITIVNDISARDVQLPQTQFYKGKSYRGFGPVGPYLVLLDASEWQQWPQLRMQLHVNGQLRQDAYCSDMIFRPHQTLTELSALQDMFPGDLIATGTPAGCAARAPGALQMWVARHFMSDPKKWKMFISKGRSNPAYLQTGDLMTASIRTDDGAIDLGTQHNRIVAS